MSMAYESVGNELRDRILALIPDNRQILTIESAWDLFGVPGFQCNDLGPSAAQAGWALCSAKKIWEEEQAKGEEKNDSISETQEKVV